MKNRSAILLVIVIVAVVSFGLGRAMKASETKAETREQKISQSFEAATGQSL